MATKRKIEDVLQFRTDISHFLVHLTKDKNSWCYIPKGERLSSKKSKDILISIIKEQQLKYGETLSAASYGMKDKEINRHMSYEEQIQYFGGICFTETPLNEIHSLLDISARQIQLQPYGFVFLKNNLKQKGVSPVFYLNNWDGRKSKVVKALRTLIVSHNDVAKEILPLISSFGKSIVSNARADDVDFSWEREWKYPSIRGNFQVDPDDIFIGLCPDGEIEEFEKLALENFGTQIAFIDPTKNMKYYANKLIEAKKRIDFKYSVI